MVERVQWQGMADLLLTERACRPGGRTAGRGARTSARRWHGSVTLCEQPWLQGRAACAQQQP